ncbi:flavin reductase family protein [Streptomyces sp. NPDC047000]|uniref:flavin reductase family protein n=1 Tax=Streptomyces sp. NPDC047000 TaxID=3155474 RepID=UPI0033EC16D6
MTTFIGPTAGVGALRAAFAGFPSGVVALSARLADGPSVLIASSFTVGVSLDPALVSFAVRNASATWPPMRAAGRLGVSVLGAEQAALCRRLASPDPAARLAGEPLETTPEGAVFFPGAAVWLDCSVFDEVPAGDHRVVLLEVHRLWHDSDAEPLVFHGSAFRRLAS